MIGENFKRLNRNTEVKGLQNNIYDLQNKCGELMIVARNTGKALPEKFWELSKEIEWQEYLLWGAKEGMLQQ